MVEKKLMRKRAPMKEGSVGAMAVKTAESTTMRALNTSVILRPRQSKTQVNRAPAIWPICQIEKTRPVVEDPPSSR